MPLPSAGCRGQRWYLDRCEPLAEAGLDAISVRDDQRVLGRKVLMDPVRSLVSGYELAEVREQPIA